MNLIGKSKIEKKQLLAKSKICKNLELQLFNELCNRPIGDIQDLYKTVTLLDDINVLAIHAPLLEGDDLCLELIGNQEHKNQLYNTAILAGELSEFYNQHIKIIIHFSLNFDTFLNMNFLEKEISEYFQYFLSKYDKISFCIENVVPCSKSNDGIVFRNGVFFDNIKLIKYYRNKLNTTRIGSVLDTCHMMATLKTSYFIFKDLYPEFVESLTIERFFKEHRDFVQLIHLSDVNNLGYLKFEHGILFTENRIDVLEELLRLYKKYDYSCDVTIEIQEDDYLVNSNFKDNYLKVQEINKKFNI